MGLLFHIKDKSCHLHHLDYHYFPAIKIEGLAECNRLYSPSFK